MPGMQQSFLKRPSYHTTVANKASLEAKIEGDCYELLAKLVSLRQKHAAVFAYLL